MSTLVASQSTTFAMEGAADPELRHFVDAQAMNCGLCRPGVDWQFQVHHSTVSNKCSILSACDRSIERSPAGRR